MDEELRRLLEANPWRKLARTLQNAETNWAQTQMYADGDESLVTAFNQKLQRGGGRRSQKRFWSDQIRFEYPPIPFIGTPEADVWLLLMNPGFSPLDYYNFIDRDEGRRRMSDHDLRDKIVPIEWLKHDDDTRFALRRELYAKSLDFSIEDPARQFYVLDDCMDTVRQQGRKIHGGYNWYGRNLFKGWQEDGGNANDQDAYFKATCQEERLQVASSRIFDLEFAPYHSICFSGPDDYREFAHAQFWGLLVKYALTHGKKLIVRGRALLKLVEKVDAEAFRSAVTQRRILMFVSAQNASLSFRNLVDVHQPSVL